jgi:hypothetical protein
VAELNVLLLAEKAGAAAAVAAAGIFVADVDTHVYE